MPLNQPPPTEAKKKLFLDFFVYGVLAAKFAEFFIFKLSFNALTVFVCVIIEPFAAFALHFYKIILAHMLVVVPEPCEGLQLCQLTDASRALRETT